MSKNHVHAAIARMNLGIAMMSPLGLGAMTSDFRELAVAPHAPEPAAITRRADDLCGAYGYGPSVREKPFAFSDGIAIIPVHGTLINRYAYGWSYVTGYNFIRAQMNAALDDDDVTLIVFDINSYGGEAAGCFELSDEIREARSRKQLLAVVDSNCCSAAYAIASACNKIIVTPSGQAGSIGVIAIHFSMEKMLTTAGVEVTIISSFAHKGDANPYKDLPEDVRKDLEKAVEKRANEFVSLVARNRNLDEDLVRGTESRTFRADEALERKLIDAVQPPAKAVSTFFAELGDEDPTDPEDDTMSTAAAPNTNAPATPATPAPAAAIDPTVLANAVASAVAADRARATAITGHAEAADRPRLASTLAAEGMSVEQAGRILAASPKEKSEGQGEGDQADGGNQLRQAMNNGKQPNVGADGGDTPQGEDGEDKDGAKAKSKHVNDTLSFFGAAPKA